MFKYDRETLAKLNMAYRGQKHSAKKRGHPFRFSFYEWVEWWERHLRPLFGLQWPEHRGSRRGKYVMARFGDKGAYEETNVKCVLHEDNGREMASNLTSPWGERNGQVKLTEKQVLEIFYMDDTQVNIADKYGITDANVRCIRNGKSWKYLTKDLAPREFQSDNRKKLTDKEVREIFNLKDDRFSIAKKYGVAPVTVWEIKHKKKRLKALAGL